MRPDEATPRADCRPTSVRWRIVALLLAFSFLSWFNRVSMSVAYDEHIRHQWPIAEADIGYVYSAFLLAYALCMTPGGYCSDRWGAWLALAVMGLGSGLFGALTGLTGLVATSAGSLVVALLIVRALMGALTAPIYPSSGQLAAHWLPFRQRAWANGLISGAALLGIAATFEGFGRLMDWLDWPAAFLVSGGVTAAVGWLWVAYARDYPEQHPGVNPAELAWIDPHAPSPDCGRHAAPTGGTAVPWLRWLRHRSLVCLTLSYAAVGYFEYLFFFWMHYYFDEVLQTGKSQSRLYATTLYLAMAAGMTLGGCLSDRLQLSFGYRLGRALVPVVGLLAGAGLLVLGLWEREPIWIVVYFSLALAAVGACEGPCWATAIELGGRQAATSAGIFNTGGNVGGMLAPVLTPLIGQRFGWTWGIAMGSLVCLFGVILWAWIDPRERLETV